MTALDNWLEEATHCLSKESAAQVRTEISDHYKSARETAISEGTTADEADRQALIALGDPRTANRQYRKVMLTSAEARMLRDGNREARAICARPWLKWLMVGIPLGALLGATVLFLNGASPAARVLLAVGIGIGLVGATPFLPVYTPARARIYRRVKWVVLTGAFALVFPPFALKWSWLIASCLWPVVWIEWTRISIRRKLPVSQWPKQLYL